MTQRPPTLLLFLLCFFLLANAAAQISPPGLGRAHTADWLALGIRQDLDSLKKWQSVSYVGLGRKSNPDNYDPLAKSAIVVLNQEVYYHFHRHWQSSLALSYRHQDAYSDAMPYEHEQPAFEQEFRLYSRLSYILATPRFKLVPTLRQEFRRFYTPSFANETEQLQLRSRLRLQLTANLDAAKVHRLIASSEQLFTTSHLLAPAHWTRFGYRESRFVLYYSLSPRALPLVFDLGYMYDLLGAQHPISVHYLAFDMIWQNPFGPHHRRQPQAARLE